MNANIENQLKPLKARYKYLDENNTKYYIGIAYGHQKLDSVQPFGERITGLTEFEKAIQVIINDLMADYVIITEYNGKAHNATVVGKPIKIILTQNPNEINSNTEINNNNLEGGLSGIDGLFKAKEEQLNATFDLKVKEHEHAVLQAKYAELLSEKNKLDNENDELFVENERLRTKVERLKKYDPNGLKLFGVDAKGLGAAIIETFASNMVLKKPDRVKALIGNDNYETLAGLFLENENEETQPNVQQPLQNIVPQANQPKTKQEEVADFWATQIKRMTMEQLQKFHSIVISIFNTETKNIENEKLNALYEIVSTQEEEATQEATQETTQE